MYENDKRIVMTLDAGGTNFVFSAMQANKEIVEPIYLDSNADNLPKCLETMVAGFTQIKKLINDEPVAISFAFPGPADYVNGVIGDLPNLKAFRGGVALGAFLKEKFEIPVYINNDGSLFAYGEAAAGILPEINAKLKANGSSKQFKNLMGFTLGTGFGGGMVINGNVNLGDNGCGGDVWVFRNKKYRDCYTEDGASIAALKRMYAEFSGSKDSNLTPKEMFEIAQGVRNGNQAAALKAFAEMGEEAGDTIAHAITVVDGIVVIGGGLTGASAFFMPALMQELNGTIGSLSGAVFPRLQTKAYNLEDKNELFDFLKDSSVQVKIPGTSKTTLYDSSKRIGIAISKLGASKAITIGAYAFALNALDTNN